MSSKAIASPAPLFGALTRVFLGVVAGPLDALEAVTAFESNNLTVSLTLLFRSPEVGLIGPEARGPKNEDVNLVTCRLDQDCVGFFFLNFFFKCIKYSDRQKIWLFCLLNVGGDRRRPRPITCM